MQEKFKETIWEQWNNAARRHRQWADKKSHAPMRDAAFGNRIWWEHACDAAEGTTFLMQTDRGAEGSPEKGGEGTDLYALVYRGGIKFFS